MAFSDRSTMRSPRERSAICAIEVIRLPVRLVSWLSSSRAMVSTCWPTLRTSCATTAKPAPCAPARELSISAFSASIFIWLVIFWIDLVFSQATWLTSAVNLRDQRGDVGFVLGARCIGWLFCDRCGPRAISATDIGGNSSVFVRLPIFCGSAGLNESVLNPLSRIMANDWFNFAVPRVVLRGQAASSLCKSLLSA